MVAVARTGGRAKGGREKDGPEHAPSGMADGVSGGDAAAADQADVVECKFKHLLEPIRDLAINWNIDIAQVLAPAPSVGVRMRTAVCSLLRAHGGRALRGCRFGCANRGGAPVLPC
jgi:hypothetical protein